MEAHPVAGPVEEMLQGLSLVEEEDFFTFFLLAHANWKKQAKKKPPRGSCSCHFQKVFTCERRETWNGEE
ncbi:hypothetical protein VIGAN_UM085100 [Vigna angularis var. angularis]|uniref:Uncharacterized protein n=1 Tax=Vigna angularis var. angularis TaxID=157739 RepID=A0A0S3TDZ7_PHAAN|nr:hypothetical protein VIGAN_UM085100 [Vigna angularis var. angularis]